MDKVTVLVGHPMVVVVDLVVHRSNHSAEIKYPEQFNKNMLRTVVTNINMFAFLIIFSFILIESNYFSEKENETKQNEANRRKFLIIPFKNTQYKNRDKT